MGNVNHAMLLGTLGADPETRTSQAGNQVTKLRLATDRRWRDKDGNNQKETDWHRAACFGRTAKIAAQYLAKGDQVCLIGRMQTSMYEKTPGDKRYTTELIVDNLQLVGAPKNDGDKQTAQPAASKSTHAPAIDFDDDIPW